MKDVVDVILRLLLWDWRETRVDGNINCLSYAPNCDIIASGCGSGELFFIDAQTGEKILCPVSCESPVLSIALKDNIIAAGCAKGEIKLFKLNESQDWGEIQSEPPLKVDAGDFGVQCVTFNGTGNTIVAGCWNGNIFFIDTATSQFREPPLRGHRYVPSLSREYFLSCS